MAQETKKPMGCCLIHGYGGNPFELEGIAAALAEAGMETRLVCLPGHGEGYEDFRRYGFSDWLAHAEKEYTTMAEHCERVALIGFSMGGALALRLAARYPVAGIVVLSSPIHVLSLWPWPLENLKFYGHSITAQARRLVRRFAALPEGETSRDIAPWKGYSGPLHFGQLASMRQGCAITRRMLPQVTAPLLIMQDARDYLVNPNNAWAIARGVASAETTVILTRIREETTRHHMITTHRETAAFVAQTVTAFCREKMLDPRHRA